MVQIKGCWHPNTSRKMPNLPRKMAVFAPGSNMRHVIDRCFVPVLAVFLTAAAGIIAAA
jgi:hypothetical protein